MSLPAIFADDAARAVRALFRLLGRDRRVAAACITGLAQRARLRAWCDPRIALCHQRHPRILTRFLCGIATPLTTRSRPDLAGFGQLADHPFAEVLAVVSALLSRRILSLQVWRRSGAENKTLADARVKPTETCLNRA
jgi:hypothetical protein